VSCYEPFTKETYIQGFGGEKNLRERDSLEDPGIGGRIVLRCIFRKWSVGVWIDLAEDRDRWRVLVNAVMNLRVS